MDNFKYWSSSKNVFVISLTIGILTLVFYAITKNFYFAIFGYFFIHIATIINLLAFSFFLISACIYSKRRVECLKSAGLLTVNIPIALLCLYISQQLLKFH